MHRVTKLLGQLQLNNCVEDVNGHIENTTTTTDTNNNSNNNSNQNNQNNQLESNNVSSATTFRYTKNSNNLLTQSQREFYEKNGYLIIKGLLTPAEVKKFYSRFDELVANPKDGPTGMTIMRDVALTNLKKTDRTHERVVTKLQNWSRDRVLWQFAKHPKVIEVVEAIVGADIRAHHFMSINKPPDPGSLSSRHPVHQDQWYFPFGPSEHIVCCWTALQHIHRGNGCLAGIPGTHHNRPGGKLLKHGYPQQWSGPVNKAYHGIQLDAAEDGVDIVNVLSQRVHFEMHKGDSIFFHPLLLHASGANLSGQNRRSISVHYCNSKLCEMYSTPQIPEQHRIKDEVEAIALRKVGVKITYEQIWRGKSRQVKGDAGCFK